MGDLPRWKVQRFSKWSYYNGQHAQVEKCKDFFFKMVKNTKIFQGVIVVMCDLTR
jgi:hypothetical protein